MKTKKILNQKSFICWCCITLIMTTPFLAYAISDLHVDSKFTITKTWLGDYDQMVKQPGTEKYYQLICKEKLKRSPLWQYHF